MSGSLAASLSAAAEAWSRMGLEGLDKAAFDIAENQKALKAKRSALQTATKAFKAADDKEKETSIPGLLKLYQGEIDRLTKAEKLAESAFLNLYRPLLDLPDMGAVLQSALDGHSGVQRAKELEVENRKLLAELESYRDEFSELTNQDVTLRALENKLKEYEADLEAQVALGVAKATAALEESHASDAAAARSAAKDGAERLAAVKAELDVARAGLDAAQSELFEVRSAAEEKVSAAAAELEIVSEDLNRAEERAREAEAALEALRAEAAAAAAGPSEADVEARHALEVAKREAEAREAKVGELLEALDQAEKAVDAEKVRSTGELTSMRNALEVAEARAAAAVAQLEKAPSHEEMAKLKSSLATLKAVHFNSLEGTGEDGDPGLTVEAGSLEEELMTKNKALEGELSRLKVSAAEAETRLAQAQAACAAAEAKAQERAEDLAKLSSAASAAGSPGGGLFTTPVKAAGSGLKSVDLFGDSSDPLAGLMVPAPKAAGEDSNMTEIETAQRDRFRLRITELEAENSDIQRHVDDLRREVESKNADNVALYEKLRYVQEFEGGAGRGKRGGGAGDGGSGGAGVGGSDLEKGREARYRIQSEARQNPFNAFHERLQNREYRKLNAVDKLTLTTGKVAFANSMTRRIVFVYTIALHLFVFVSLYWSASTCAFTENDDEIWHQTHQQSGEGHQ